jgi:hypothetical protein
MYTVPPLIRRRGLSYRWGLGFMAAAILVMVGVNWRIGGFRTSPAFYACTFGLMPLSLSVWPVAVAGIRRGRQRFHALVIVTLALISPVCYMEIIYIIDHLEDSHIRRIFWDLGRRLSVAEPRRWGTWTTFWLEAIIAWAIVLVALIAALRRWCLAPEPDEET